MAYLIQYKQKKQVLNTLLVLALVISNLVMPYDNPALAQSSLRQRATFQIKGPRSDLEASLIEPEKSTSITPQTPSTAGASSVAEQIKEFIIKLRTTQKDIYKDRNQPPFKGTFKKKINQAQNLYLVGWREGKKVHQVVAYLPFIPPQTEVTLSCHFLEEPPKGIEKQWVLMIDTPKDTAFRLFTGKGIYLAPIKLPLASRKGGLALAKIAPEQDVTVFAKLGNFTDPRNPPCSQDRFSITPYTYGVVYLGSWKETDEQGKHKTHHLRMSISSNHLEKDKNGKFLPLYIEPVYIKGIPKRLGGSQWILIAQTLTGNRYYRFKKEGKYHLIQVNNRNIPLGFRMADETIVERITPQVALKSSSAGGVRQALERFINSVGKDEQTIFRFREGLGLPESKNDSSYSEWEAKRKDFSDAVRALIDSVPVVYDTGSETDGSLVLSSILMDIFQNSYDGIASFYDPVVRPEGLPEGYKGIITISFGLDGENFAIKIADNGMGKDSATNERKKAVAKEIDFYFGGENAGLGEIGVKGKVEKLGGDFKLYKGPAKTMRAEAILTIPLDRLAIKEQPVPAESLPALGSDGHSRVKASSTGEADEQGKARNIEEGRELTKLIGMAMLPNYLRLLLIEQDQQIPLTAPMVRIKLPAWMMQDERIVNPTVRKIVDLVKELLAELKSRNVVFEETLQDVNIMASLVESKDMGDNLAERFYSALKESKEPTQNTKLSELIAQNTGRLLATLHNNGIIADDTHCYQFIAGEKGEVRRIDLPHVYIFNPKVANHLMRSRDEGGYGFTEAELKSMNIYPYAIPDESVLAEINSLLLHPNVLLHPLFVIPFAKTYLEYARDISPKVRKYVEEVWIKNAEQALENWEGRKDKERPEKGSKASSAGAVMELPRVDVGPYMERVDCVRSYLDRLSKKLEKEEDLLDEISKTQGAEGLIADTTAGVRKARVRLKQAEINIKRLSRAMKEQNLPSLINALRKIPNGAEERLSRLQTLAFLFVKEIAKLSKETARPHPVIDFNPWAVLFIPQKSWLSDMFGFRSAGKIVEISDGENSSEILLIKAEEKSLVEIIKSILHESIHRRFTRGRRIIEETQPELLPFYHILEEAATESLTMEIFEYLKKTELGHYLLEEIPKKGIYDYISTEEYYLYEREFLKVLRRNLEEKIGESLEEFLTKGNPEQLREALGDRAEELVEKLLTGDDARPLKKVLESQARRCIDEFLINANPEPLKKILGPLWERLTSITERINIFNDVDVSKQDLVYDTAVRMMFLFLPHPDAGAKLDAGILLLDALEEMDLGDIAEVEFKLFLEFGPESFNQCIDKAVLRVVKEILRAERIDLKTARSDFQDKLYRYTTEEAGRMMKGAKERSQEDIKSSSAGVVADEKYIRDRGYNLIGGTENRWLSERLTNLTGLNALAHNPAVYSPLHDKGHYEAASLEFASATAERIKELADSFKPKGKNSIRILVVGSGTGIDAICAFHHAKFVEQFESVVVHAIDIQKEAVENTKFNFVLRLPRSGFKGEALQFTGEEFKNDSIIVKHVVEGKEFDGLDGRYDIILFHAPDAIGLGGIYDTRVEMNQSVFKAILENIRERLSEDGVVLVKNKRSILDAGLIPAGFHVMFASSDVDLRAILAPVERTSWTIFKLTLDKSKQQRRLPNTDGSKPSLKIKMLLDSEKAISQSA